MRPHSRREKMRKSLLVLVTGLVTLAMAFPVSALCYKCTYILFVGYTCEEKTSGYDACSKSPSANYCKMGNAMCGSGGCGSGEGGCTPEQKDASMTPDSDTSEAIVVLASSDNMASMLSRPSACGYVIE
jgi:hypothetical protein